MKSFSQVQLLAFGLGMAACLVSPAAGQTPWVRQRASDVRVVSYNTEGFFVVDSSQDQRFRRVLQAMRPDILVMQEVEASLTDEQITTRMNSIIPRAEGSWQVHRGIATGIQTVILTPWPMTLQRTDTTPTSSTRGVTMALVDVPSDRGASDIYVLGVHLKCCNSVGTEDNQRQRSADAIAAWMGDARQAGGRITLAANTPMIVLGDFNLVGGPGPELTLRTGNISDNITFGPDVKGDWDASDLLDVQPADPVTRVLETWPSTSNPPTSRLDRFYLTDSAETPVQAFVFNPATMASATRTALGVQSTDCSGSADHLPIVLDLNLLPDPAPRTGWMTR